MSRGAVGDERRYGKIKLATLEKIPAKHGRDGDISRERIAVSISCFYPCF